MRDKASAFLTAVLGAPGAAALAALAKSAPGLDGYLVPRAALAWLRLTPEATGLPGCPAVEMTLTKSGGHIKIGDEVFGWGDGDRNFASAAIACVLGVAPGAVGLKDRDIAGLGRTVDLLAKAQTKRPDIEGTGAAAGPIGPLAPAAPTPTAPQAPGAGSKKRRIKIPLTPKAAAPVAEKPLALSEADEHRKCSTCGEGQFKNGKFKGCWCIRGLVKSISSTRRSDGRLGVDLSRLGADDAALVIDLLKGAIGDVR